MTTNLVENPASSACQCRTDTPPLSFHTEKATRFRYLPLNMNITDRLASIQVTSTVQKVALATATFVFAILEAFVKNGLFLIANGGIYLANQTHSLYQKFTNRNIESIRLASALDEMEKSTVADLPEVQTTADIPAAPVQEQEVPAEVLSVLPPVEEVLVQPEDNASVEVAADVVESAPALLVTEEEEEEEAEVPLEQPEGAALVGVVADEEKVVADAPINPLWGGNVEPFVDGSIELNSEAGSEVGDKEAEALVDGSIELNSEASSEASSKEDFDISIEKTPEQGYESDSDLDIDIK